jgi:GH15 family glucan-1,4-alpha-glucosidase
MEDATMTYQPIENYGIISDLYTVALVGTDGSIDFMSFPHFDSPTVFAALLDHQKGGHFKVAPVLEDARHKQMYLPDSNILITRFLSREGVAEVSDFMPVEKTGHDLAHNLVRRAKMVRGEVHFRMVCEPRFDCARAPHRVEQRDGEIVFVSQGPDKTALRLRTPIPVRVENGAIDADDVFCRPYRPALAVYHASDSRGPGG